MRFGVIAKYIGNSLLLVAAAMAVSAGVSAHNGFDGGFFPLLFSCVMTAILGAFPNIFVHGGQSINHQEGYCIVVGSWIASCLMGMVPYLMFGGEFSFTDALFETISGFTTTGASILTDIESLPMGLLFWRMSTAWIGGIGIIALFSLFVPSSQRSDTTLNSAEMSSIARSADGMRQRPFAHVTISVYVVLTVLATVSLRLTGLRWFDAATQAMSACSTCGFSTRNSSIASFGSFPVEAVMVVFMILCSIRFSLLGCLPGNRKGRCSILTSDVTKAFLGSIVFAAAAVTAGLYAEGGNGTVLNCLRLSIFQVASIFTTTGFATADTNSWPSICMMFLVSGSVVCGCSGSTSGGIKTDRAVISWKFLKNRIYRQRNPNLVANTVVDGMVIKEETVSEILLFIVCYMALTVSGALLYTADGLDLRTAGTAAVACMGNVGPGLGTIGSMGNYSGLPTASKYISMVLMFVGRLEIFPLIYAFRHKSRIS